MLHIVSSSSSLFVKRFTSQAFIAFPKFRGCLSGLIKILRPIPHCIYLLFRTAGPSVNITCATISAHISKMVDINVATWDALQALGIILRIIIGIVTGVTEEGAAAIASL